MSLTKMLGALILLLSLVQAAFSIEVVKKENATLNMHGRIQALGFANYVDDPMRDKLRIYLFLKQTRLSFDGMINTIKYNTELAFGGEEGLRNAAGTVTNSSLGLLDFYVDIPAFGSTYIKVGQYKVPYGLERLTHSGSLLFVDRSFQTQVFTAGRDVGVSLYNNTDRYAYALGVFTGVGRDIPIRNIPLSLGTPMLSLRVGIKDGGDDDLYNPKQISEDSLKPGMGVFANAFYIKDSRVGHSTTLQVKPVEKSLLTDSGWNPFIGQADPIGGSNFLMGDLWQAGGDITYRTEAGPGLLSAEVEANYGLYKNAAGNLDAVGGRAQTGYHLGKWAFALRYAVLFPNDKFAKSTTKIFSNREPLHEITPAIMFFHKKNIKIVADAPVQINTPVANESRIGSYVLMYQPDQTGAGTIERQVVPTGRLLLQFEF